MKLEDVFTKAVAILPGFKPYWDKHLQYWEGKERGVITDFSVLVDYAYDLMQKTDSKESLQILAEFIETCVIDADESTRYGATIGFLEGITNRLSHEKPVAPGWKDFFESAGPETKKSLTALDDFWGTDPL